MSAEDHNRDPSTHVDPAAEEHNLDSLARGLASGSISRRQAVRWMGGALLGSVLAIVPGVEAFAAPKPPQGRCPAGFVNCRGTCVKTQTNPSHCGGCYIQCSPGETCCKGQCANLETDPNNCRSCGAACPPGATCEGDFGCICPGGFSGPCGADQNGTGGTCCEADAQCCDFGGGSAVCCPSGTNCAGPGLCCLPGEVGCGGACVSSACPEGQSFNRITCQCVDNAPGCASGGYDCGEQPIPFCGSSGNCLCTTSVEGPVICGDLSCQGGCTSSRECEQRLGPGAVCQAPGTGCCGQQCIAACGSPSATSSVSSTGERNIR
jgi:hypothetical protein